MAGVVEGMSEDFDSEAGYRDLIANVAAGEVRLSDPPSGAALDARDLDRLATLSEIDYERERETAARVLGIRVAVLDAEVKRRRGANGSGEPKQGRALELREPDPWHDPVDGAVLLDELAGTFTRYLALPDGAADAAVLWLMHSHAFDASPITPRLAITSPEKRCGKTTLLRIIQALAAKSLMASNISAAAMFRTIEAVRPCLLVDEADSFLRDNEELRGIVNSGHARDGWIIRAVGDDNEPRQFSTWAPVAIACIGDLPGTIADRSIHIPMRRRRPDEAVERLRFDRLEQFKPLARKCARWAVDHAVTLAALDPEMPAFLHDRAADNWRPLLAIADVAGGDWPDRARAAAQLLSAGQAVEDDSARVTLLGDIKAMFDSDGTDRLRSDAIIGRLALMEDRPWPEWRHGKPITTRQLARLLSPLEIAPGTIRLSDDTTAKGYMIEAFTDAFARYLPADPSQRHNPHEIDISYDSRSVTSQTMLRIEKCTRPNNDGHCDVVTDPNPVPAEEDMEWMA